MQTIIFDKHIKKLNKKYDFQKKDQRKEILKILLDYAISLDINPIYADSFMPLPAYYLDDENDPRIVLYTLRKELFPNIDYDYSETLGNKNFPNVSELKSQFNQIYTKFTSEFTGLDFIKEEPQIGDYVKLFNADKQKVYTGVLEENPRKQIFNINWFDGKSSGDYLELKFGSKNYNLQIIGYARKNENKKLEYVDLQWYFPFDNLNSLDNFYKKMKLKVFTKLLLDNIVYDFLTYQMEFIEMNYEFENLNDLIAMYEIQTGSKNAKVEIILKLISWINSFNYHNLNLDLHQKTIMKEMANVYFEKDDRYDEETGFNTFNEYLNLIKISNKNAYETILTLLNEFSL
ncbi:MAG: hypothetical protein ACTTJO_03180 [Metamycoplasmataceae bacterium]